MGQAPPVEIDLALAPIRMFSWPDWITCGHHRHLVPRE
jgi:hypothetical protein